MATELNVKLNNTLDGTSLKAIQDKSGNDIADTYFSKSGGALSGNITFNNDHSVLKLCGATSYRNGAFINLIGNISSNDAGAFQLCATKDYDNGDTGVLEGFPNGKLNWSLNKVPTDLAGSAIVAKSIGQSGYIKYASGLIIQWGHYFLPQGTQSSHINLTIPLPISCTQILSATGCHICDTNSTPSTCTYRYNISTGKQIVFDVAITSKATVNLIYGGVAWIATCI